jgi:hypothetical protein
MAGETDLAKLLRTLRPVLHPEVYVFATLKRGESRPPGITPVMTFREPEGRTMIVLEEEARLAGLESEFRCRMISLEAHSSLAAVGLLAVITTQLAKSGISVNVVSAYFHDHLFLPVERSEEALAILNSLAGARP